MFRLALVFFILSLVAYIAGFYRIGDLAADTANLFAIIFVGLGSISLIARLAADRRPGPVDPNRYLDFRAQAKNTLKEKES